MALPALKVHANGRYLATADGKPFLLFHRLNREEAMRYLRNAHPKITVEPGPYHPGVDWLGERGYYSTEYFAEGTEAFFDRNDFFPLFRAEPKEHDPGLYDHLEEIWGVKTESVSRLEAHSCLTTCKQNLPVFSRSLHW